MKSVWTTLVFFAVTGSARADDWTKLEGKWIPIGMELGGTKFDATILKDTTLTMGKETYEVVSQKTPDKGTLKIAEDKKPKQMDVVGTDGPNKGKTFLAIYEFDGEMLKICYDLKGKTRPTEFKATSDNGFFMAVYKRDKN